MYLNETYGRIHVGKHLSHMFPIKNGLKQGDGLSPNIAFQCCLLHVTFFATLSSVLSCWHNLHEDPTQLSDLLMFEVKATYVSI